MSSTAKKPTLSKNGKRLGRPPKDAAPKLTVVKEPRLSKNGKRLGRPPKAKTLVLDVPARKPVVEAPSFWKRWFGWLV